MVAALADAGLHASQVDGLVSYTIDPVEETELVRVHWGAARSIGPAECPTAAGARRASCCTRRRPSLPDLPTWWSPTGQIKARSGARFGRAEVSNRPSSSHAGTTAGQWCSPYGVLTPASWMSLNATRYMHATGTTSADFGRAVVQMRDYAATNPNAHFYGRPITLDDHQASRWIAEPCIRLFDCCQETDGAVALVITRTDRAEDSRAPVAIAAAASAAVFEEEVASNHYRPDLSVMDSSRSLAARLFDRTGISRNDLDVAMVYDAFTPILFMQLEGLGLCGYGEAKDFVADGHLGPTGSLPCNTNGGLIGEGYIHGLNLTTEAVRQLRGESCNQVDGAHTVLVSASRTGVILQGRDVSVAPAGAAGPWSAGIRTQPHG